MRARAREISTIEKREAEPPKTCRSQAEPGNERRYASREGDPDPLLPIPQRLDHAEHFLEIDEAAAVHEFVPVDGVGEFGGVGRKLFVRVRELPTLAGRRLG